MSPPNTAWARSRRLMLDEFGPDDAPAIVEMHRDARLRAHLIDDLPLDVPAVARVFIERLEALYRRHEGLGIWRATLRAPAPAFVGWFSLMPMTGHPGDAEIGSRLLPAHWGSGLAVEGGEHLLDHAFDDLALPRVWGICHPHNRPAQAVLGSLGFERLGVRPYDGAPASHYRIELNAWRTVRNLPRATRLRQTLRGTRQAPGGVELETSA
ncbi:MAG: GNAT family N-acetyltransferase [Rubrivivax sp.]